VETAIKDVPASAVFSKTALDAQLVKQGLPESEAVEVVAAMNPETAEEKGAAVAPSGIFINVHPGWFTLSAGGEREGGTVWGGRG